MRYVRIFSDATGASHFQDVEVQAAALGDADALISERLAVSGLMFRQVGASAVPAWHVAPRRQFVVHVKGEVEVEVSDGEVRRFGPGSVVLVEDTHGAGHITRALGGRARTTLFIALQEAEGPLG
jgi:hypothetical protein